MADWLLALAILLLVIVTVIQEVQIKTLGRRYVKLEEWSEDWLKRLEQKDEAQTDNMAKVLVKIADIENLLPKNGKGELIRNQELLEQYNDEMERGLRMEREWNDGVANIINYGNRRGDKQ